MPTKTRLPTNTINGLEDIVALCLKAKRQYDEVMARATKTDDLIAQALLGKLFRTISDIETKAMRARRNEYIDDGHGQH